MHKSPLKLLKSSNDDFVNFKGDLCNFMVKQQKSRRTYLFHRNNQIYVNFFILRENLNKTESFKNCRMYKLF
jgi:hypothetical protein